MIQELNSKVMQLDKKIEDVDHEQEKMFRVKRPEEMLEDLSK